MRSEIERHLRRGVEALEAFVARRGVGADRAVE
jgi:hypothetical protein